MKRSISVFGKTHEVGGGIAWILVVVAVAVACVLAAASTVRGIATFSGVDPTGFSHLVNDPDDYATWLPDTTLTYRFDASFDTVWPNPQIKEQVRVAFNQWSSANITPDGAVYAYERAGGAQPFGDIRSIVVHELGHVLGITHPNQAAGVNRNWRPGGGGLVAQADVGNELMRSWINQGDYNHVLSHDELDAYDLMYGTGISFTQSLGGAADIVISAYNPGDPNNWAEGGGHFQWRNPSDHSEGMRFIDGFVHLNQASGFPLGFQSLGINWDYQNAGGKPTRAFQVQTTGTNYPTPLFHYDNNGPHQFNSFGTTTVDADHKDDLIHRWSNPAGGDIPHTEILHVGLEQDVYDWSVVEARVHHPDGTSTMAPLLGFHDWSNTIVTGTPAVEAATVEFPLIRGRLDRAGDVRVLARGFRIVASDRSLVSNLMLANARGLDLKLEDLNRNTLNELREKQLVEEIKDFGVRQLGRGEDFLIVLEGEVDDLPKEVVEKGNFLLLNRPDLLKSELFVFARSLGQQQEAEIGTFALLGTPPVVGLGGPWLPGDYNLSGAVENRDLQVWEENFVDIGDHRNAYTVLTADGNQNGVIDGGDFLLWQRQRGKALSLAGSGVPEPTTAALLILAAVGLAVQVRRRS
jgi:hypothetical protein